MAKKLLSVIISVLLIISALGVTTAFANDETEILGPGTGESTLPEVAEGCNRYFFYLPKTWENELSNVAGIYWWEGTGAQDRYPGVEAHKGDAEGLYYYDVPKDVCTVIWNNFLDGGTDFDSPEYEAAKQTENISTEYYEPGESTLYPDGLESFNNMVYVVDFEKCSCNDFTLPKRIGGDWYYYYGNGEYGTSPVKGEVVYTDRSIGEHCPHEKPSTPTTPTEPELEPYNRIYFVNTEGWEKVYAYVWMNDYEYQNALWPGEEMELLTVDSAGNEIYTALITSKAYGLIFSDGENKQTIDLTSGIYEDNMYCLFKESDGRYTVMIREFISDYPMGDANLDGSFNVKDATYVQKYVAGLIVMADRFEQSLMDFDKDTQINVKDATAMQKNIAGLI